jgi:hypothetical protein
MLRVSLALTLMASMIFAGCLDGGSGLETSASPVPGGDGSPSPSPTPASTSSAPSGGGSSGSDDNHAPEAALVVQRDQKALKDDNGVVAIEAEGPLTFDASASSDVDGDKLSYVWLVDGDVDDSLKGDKVTLTLTPGTHVVAVQVSDGEAMDEEDVTVQVGPVLFDVSGDGAEGGAVKYHFNGSFDATTMASIAMMEDASQVHAFDMPVGASKIIVYLEWFDDVAAYPLIGPTSLVNGPVGNIDVAILDPAGEEFAAGEGKVSFEYLSIADEENLTAGAWSISVNPVATPVPIDYAVDVVVFVGAPTVHEFNGSFQAQQAVTSIAGADLPVDGVAATHTVTVPEGVKGIVARLEWSVADAPAGAEIASDLDLSAMVGDVELLASGNFLAFEFDSLVSAEGIPAGEWVFEVSPFAAPKTDYVLTVEFL